MTDGWAGCSECAWRVTGAASMMEAANWLREHREGHRPDPALGMKIVKCPHCDEELSVWAAPAPLDGLDDIPGPHPDSPDWHAGYRAGRSEAAPLAGLRCVKCGGTDIGRAWHQDTFAGRGMRTCSYSQQYAEGQNGEHLHQNCRNCGFEWRAALRDEGETT